MNPDDPKHRILDTAEPLFFQNGYRHVSMKQIAQELALVSSALYYHFPGGKEQLYLTVLQRRFEACRLVIESGYRQHSSLRDFLKHLAWWYVDQPPMNMQVIMQMDFPFLTKVGHQQLLRISDEGFFQPLIAVFRYYREQLNPDFDPPWLVGHLLSMLGTLTRTENFGIARSEAVDRMIDLYLNGVYTRTSRASAADPAPLQADFTSDRPVS
jgi:AcrR family transcriptional regulator